MGNGRGKPLATAALLLVAVTGCSAGNSDPVASGSPGGYCGRHAGRNAISAGCQCHGH